MRKLAPVFLSSAILLGSASALAMGDMNKNKKAANADTPSQTSPTYSAPSAPTTTAPSAMPSVAPAATGGTGANEARPGAAPGVTSSSTGASPAPMGAASSPSASTSSPAATTSSGAVSSGSGTATDKPGPINDSDKSSRKAADSYSGAGAMKSPQGPSGR